MFQLTNFWGLFNSGQLRVSEGQSPALAACGNKTIKGSEQKSEQKEKIVALFERIPALDRY
jgi:hypothetical protein